MAEQKIHNDIAILARLAGISVPEPRQAALAVGLAGTQAICDTLARIDYDRTEPASRFQAPPAR